MYLLSLIALSSAVPANNSQLHDQLVHRMEYPDGEGGCLTGLIMDLKNNWSSLSPEEQAEATALFSPFKTDLAQALPSTRAAGQAVPPPSPVDTCYGQQADNRLISEHFSVEWNTGSVSDAAAQSFLEDLEYAYQAEVVEQGWRPPAGDGQYLMLAMIADQNMGGAYTTVEACGNIYAPYMVAGKDAVNYGSWTEEMAAHEFNHSLQFNYSFAPEFWWWEATATYVQSEVRSSRNWADYLSGYTELPYIALGASSQRDQDVFWHMYGLSIFAHYLSDYHGGRDTVRDSWENASHYHSQYTYGGQDIVEGLGLDWQETWADFITRNTCMEYTQQQYYPGISITDTISSFPASGGESGSRSPQGYGENYIRFDGGHGTGDLHITFSGDTSTDWMIILAETDGDTVLSSVSAIATLGAGDITFPNYGENDVFLVVSPMITTESGFDYTWNAELVTVPGEDTATDTGDNGNNGDSTPNVDNGQFDDKETNIEAVGCGCASTQALPMSLWILGLAGVLIRRR